MALTNSNFGNFCLFMTAWLLLSVSVYNFVLLNPLAPAMRTMYETTHMSRYNETMPEDTWTILYAVSVSCIYFGGLIGGVGMNFMLSYVSRKGLMQLSHVINITGVIVIALVAGTTWSYEALIIGRIIGGISLGMAYNLPCLMVSEMSANYKQNFWQSVIGLSSAFGILLGSIFSHPKILGSLSLWTVLVSLAVIPSLIYLISSHWIPNTPFYVLRTYGKDEALKVLKKLRKGTLAEIKEELASMSEEIGGKRKVRIKEMLTTKEYRDMFVGVIALCLSAILVGVDNVLLYSDQIFIDAGISPDKATYATIGVFAMQLLAGVVGSKIVDRFGGFKVHVASNILIIFAHVTYTVSQLATPAAPNAMPYVAIFAVGIFLIAWSGGTNLTTFALLGEITSEPTRSTAYGYSAAILWVVAWVASFIPPYLQIYLGSYALTIWIGFAVLFILFDVKLISRLRRQRRHEARVHRGPESIELKA
uniref:solute carrier family 2, facilitated glucose transporter member 5-like n=1 Tax=Ciona intestinalis TaxID=7719 RepID=UPI000180B41F|nr:solute carrier family 2, facilitated glucose transporter member 5-like [Ciona intestinalis]XP_018670992.1 solute carrier family 2, facilitated glucose transporter member 5-like [Ciona intestinalis]|eukprot:XP_009861323.2 solute carrier family 2, facilitated glucose transporter member 5-like [Ciona intestinalis]